MICVTNRLLCKDDFLSRMNLIAHGKPEAIILREKDLSLVEYESLAREMKEICERNQVLLVLNKNSEIALRLELSAIHLSLQDLRNLVNSKRGFLHIGASVHSVEEAKEAWKLGATYLIAGHIFATDCKKGLAPRGLSFLKSVCESVPIPVYAIGGITQEDGKNISRSGAKGVCVMSEAMTCSDPNSIVDRFHSVFT